jgi:hypothetical protein
MTLLTLIESYLGQSTHTSAVTAATMQGRSTSPLASEAGSSKRPRATAACEACREVVPCCIHTSLMIDRQAEAGMLGGAALC